MLPLMYGEYGIAGTYLRRLLVDLLQCWIPVKVFPKPQIQ